MKILLLSFVLLLGASCKNPSESNKPAKEDEDIKPVTSIEDDIVILAKQKADSVFFYVNIAVNEMAGTTSEKVKKAASQRMDKMCKPFQKSLDSLKLLAPSRVKEIDDYRQALLNKVQNGM